MATSDSSEAPFPTATALSTDRLKIPDLQRHNPASSSTSDELDESLLHVPGEPTVSLSPAEVRSFLTRELCTPVLDELYNRLWLVARKSGGSIDALHCQRIKERHIVPTEILSSILSGITTRYISNPYPSAYSITTSGWPICLHRWIQYRPA